MIDIVGFVKNLFIKPKTQTFEAKPGAFGGGYNNNSAYGDSRSGGAKYPYGLSASGSGMFLNHWALRQNARDAYHETMQARALVERFTDTVVDTGLMLESVPKHEILGITAEQAESWSRNVEESFDSWARSKKSYISENMNFYQTQRLYGIGQQRDGENFIRLFYSDKRDLISPLQIGLIDPNQIRGAEFTSTFGYKSADDGIIRDSKGKEIKYKIWVQLENDYKYKNVEVPAVGPRSKRTMMLHGYTPEYSFQGRGYSRLAHALQEFENLTDFSLAQIKKAINQSNMNLYVKPSSDNPASNPFEDITNQAGPRNLTVSDTGDSFDAVSSPVVSVCPLPEATVDTPGSTSVFNLNEGEDLKPFPETAPSDSYGNFVNSFTSYLCASVSMPLEVMLMKFNENYSASRASLILFWRVAQIWRNEMEVDFLNPVYESWLSEEIASGRVKAPGWQDPRLKAAWINARWIGSPMPNIDPMKTAKSDQLYVEMGAQTLDRVAKNLNGSSGKSNRAKISREFQEIPESPFLKKIK